MNNNNEQEQEWSPSLPDVKSPEALRLAADVLSNLETDADHYHLCNDLIDLADRLELEQSAKGTRDAAIERAARVMYKGYNNNKGDWRLASGASRELYRKYADHLFDAGLLNVDGTDE